MTTAPYPEAVAKLTALGATSDDVAHPAATGDAERHPVRVPPRSQHVPVEPKGRKQRSAEIASARIIEYNRRQSGRGPEVRAGRSDSTPRRSNTSTPRRKRPTRRTSRRDSREARAVIDSILSSGSYSAIMVPQRQPARRHRRPGRVSGADRAGRVRCCRTAPPAATRSGSTSSPPRKRSRSCLGTGTRSSRGMNARLAGPQYMVLRRTPDVLRGAERDEPEHLRCVLAARSSRSMSATPGDLENRLPRG